MKLDYVPLLPIQRDLYRIPRGTAPDFNGLKRFKHYLRTFATADGKGLEYPPLVAINPMAKDPVATLLDAHLAMDTDAIARRAASEAITEVADVPGDFKATTIIVDDWMGSWAIRTPTEFEQRCLPGFPDRLPRWTKHFWVNAVLWSSEPASEQTTREAMRTVIFRLAYVYRHGPARTLREMLAQEGWVMAKAGCTSPTLDEEDIVYTREVLLPFLEETDKRTCMECLFGDEAGRSLGFTPRGLSPRAGLALALHDACAAHSHRHDDIHCQQSA